ncbi:TetR/AcrR family transcriptional regulator [Patulibacter defluvii]|uniref:TetR/AcrR family transcriptional regulator n=1 Tax=Patulibacter defluvii TaxID=3095358 RepID=UPI002A74F9FC|nr:TetR family transcriptional regulator [Patulibacter sp. DM4]
MSRGPTPSFADATRSLLRRTLLEAARELAAERPWRAVTMAAIAERAGVSRQTLYNEFGARGPLTEALVMYEVDRFIAAVEAAVAARATDPAEALTAALDVFLTAVAEDPLVRAVVTEDGRDELLPLVTSQAAPLLGYARERLAAILSGHWSHVAEDEVRFMADTLVRLALSYVVLPVDDPRPTIDGITRMLRPYAQQVLGGVPAEG